MKIQYFAQTDTLHIEFRDAPVAETRDLDENTLLDVDAQGGIVAITVEHASERAVIPEISPSILEAWHEHCGNIGRESPPR